MYNFYQWLFIGVALNLVFFLLCVYVVWRLFRAFLGMERGIWAVVTQLRIANQERGHTAADASPVIDHEATRRAHQIANSQFGR